MTKINNDQDPMTPSQWLRSWMDRRLTKEEKRARRQQEEELHRLSMQLLVEDFEAVRAEGGNPYKLLPLVPLANDALDRSELDLRGADDPNS